MPVTTEKQLFYGIYTASGRSLYLNSKYINLKNNTIAVYTAKKSYLPGETVTVFVETGTEGTLHIEAPEYSEDFDINGNMNFSFTAPDLPSGSYPIRYTFTCPGKETKGICYFDIEGLDIKIRELQLKKRDYKPLDTLKIHSSIYSNRSFNATFSFELYDFSNEQIEKIETERVLDVGENTLSFKIPFSTPSSGIHKLLYEIGDFYGTEYFDVRGPIIYSITTSKGVYTPGEEKYVTIETRGEDMVRIYLDGNAIYEGYVDSDELVVPLYTASEGFHSVKAKIVSNISNEKKVGFFVFKTSKSESPERSETFTANPLAYKSLAEATLSKINQEMLVVEGLIEVKKDELDLENIEKTLTTIKTYIAEGKKAMDSRNYITANSKFNTALDEIVELEDYLINV